MNVKQNQEENDQIKIAKFLGTTLPWKLPLLIRENHDGFFTHFMVCKIFHMHTNLHLSQTWIIINTNTAGTLNPIVLTWSSKLNGRSNLLPYIASFTNCWNRCMDTNLDKHKKERCLVGVSVPSDRLNILHKRRIEMWTRGPTSYEWNALSDTLKWWRPNRANLTSSSPHIETLPGTEGSW